VVSGKLVRGDIHLADLADPIGHEQGLRRPVLILSNPRWLTGTPPVVHVLPITRTYWESPYRIELGTETSGLRETSYIRCEDIMAISPERLIRSFGHADSVVMFQAEQAVARLLGLAALRGDHRGAL
jgi:mRNA interferase MazF